MIPLNQDFYDFVSSHANDDVASLRLRLAGRPMSFPLDLALVQIEARRKCRQKLAPFLSSREFLFPTLLSAEQASDWRVASSHASDVGGKKVLDLTAGLGIDALSMAKKGAEVTCVEIEPFKCEVLRHNAEKLSLPVTVICGDAAEIVVTLPDDTFDQVYIDPARRDSAGKRTYAFADCTPDVTVLGPEMLRVAPKFVVKSSPLLDLSAVKGQLPNVSAMEVTSVKGEVKEVLVTVSRLPAETCPVTMTIIGATGEAQSWTVPFASVGSHASALASDEDIAEGKWLCEPDGAVMKVHPWAEFSTRWPELKKVASDTHLFISKTRPADFPGRVLKIFSLPDRKAAKSLSGKLINVVTRNYPGGTEGLKRKFRLTDGGEEFLYAFRSPSGRPVVALCREE